MLQLEPLNRLSENDHSGKITSILALVYRIQPSLYIIKLMLHIKK